MSEAPVPLASPGFGRYLRDLRTSRRYSLDTVAHLSRRYPERITKSYLSRIENGHALPTFPRLVALGGIYGIPISAISERFEIDLAADAQQTMYHRRPPAELMEEALGLARQGEPNRALVRYQFLLDHAPAGSIDRVLTRLRRIGCLIATGRYISAKEDCEALLGEPGVEGENWLIVMERFTTCCLRLGKLAVAELALAGIRERLETDTPLTRARCCLEVTAANVHHALGRHERAIRGYRLALQGFDQLGDRPESCRTRLTLASVHIDRGQYAVAGRLAQEGLRAAERAGLRRQQATGTSLLAELAFRRAAYGKAELGFVASNKLARSVDCTSLVFRNCYYLMKIAQLTQNRRGVAANRRTLAALAERIDQTLPELAAYRANGTGGAS